MRKRRFQVPRKCLWFSWLCDRKKKQNVTKNEKLITIIIIIISKKWIKTLLIVQRYFDIFFYYDRPTLLLWPIIKINFTCKPKDEIISHTTSIRKRRFHVSRKYLWFSCLCHKQKKSRIFLKNYSSRSSRIQFQCSVKSGLPVN